MESVAVRAAATVGVKVTLMLHFAPAATLVPQVLVCAKSPGLAPVIVILLMVSVAFPVLERVTLCAALVRSEERRVGDTGVGDKLATGADVPVPVKDTV